METSTRGTRIAEGREDVAEQNHAVGLERAPRLKRDLGDQIDRLGPLAEARVLHRQVAVLLHVPPGLAHHPRGRALHGQTLRRANEQGLGGIGRRRDREGTAAARGRRPRGGRELRRAPATSALREATREARARVDGKATAGAAENAAMSRAGVGEERREDARESTARGREGGIRRGADRMWRAGGAPRVRRGRHRRRVSSHRAPTPGSPDPPVGRGATALVIGRTPATDPRCADS